MKNLDIEEIERKNIYKVPDNFFAKMQANVLQEMVPKKQGKIIKMNWAYSAAAAVALLFGITFFVNQNGVTKFTTENKKVANDVSIPVTNSLTAIKPQTQSVADDEIAGQDLTNAVVSNQKKETERNNVVSVENEAAFKKVSANRKSSDAQVDQILANFSSADIADVGKNVEQDIYLDLYN